MSKLKKLGAVIKDTSLRNIILLTYRRIDGRQRFFPNGIKKTYQIGYVNLTINSIDEGGTYYDSRKSYEECSSKLYDVIQNEYHPNFFLDIGANYGFISIIAAKKFPNAKIISVEPSKKLIPFIELNFKQNQVSNFEIINAVCGEKEKSSHDFSINPNSSQDNRVHGENSRWHKESTSMVSISSLLNDVKKSENIFIKIDTQGYEEMVFEGADEFFNSNNKWIVKTEFAPYWINSQGGDVNGFLKKLINKYEVVELPSTIPYMTESVNELFFNPIQLENVDSFITHIENLNVDKRGWVDLLIRPKIFN